MHDCVEVIGRVKSFDVSSALDALELADAIEDSEATILRRRAMQYVVAHFEEVAAAERFHKLVGTSVYYAIIAAVYQVINSLFQCTVTDIIIVERLLCPAGIPTSAAA